MSEQNELLILLQISDSAFPTGGFSHSGGVESALKHNIVTNKSELRDCFGYCVENAGSFWIPFVTASYNACFEIEKLVAIDNHCDVCTPNHVAKRASTRQGRSMLETCGKSFANSQMVSLLDQLQCCHLPVVYGACCGIMGINIKSTMTTFLYSTLRSSIASSIRLDKVGPIEAQIIQTNLQKTIPDVVDRYRYRTVEEACIVFPVIDMIQNAHDNMFSKLFYS
ncbi:ureF [Mytilus edulis]|uniref:UreF n=1 Tax=Mytilus edulis TaxID=6550 RepID=A0A8S3S2W7_MYTED|nr:ureF [Mytilus edulis]